MKRIIFIALIPLSFIYAVAQEIPDDFPMYKVRVKLIDSKKTISGTFYSIGDSTITLSDSYKRKHYRRGEYDTLTIPIAKIQMIKVRKKGKGGKSAAMGFATGAAIGGLLGYGAAEAADGYLSKGGTTAGMGIIFGFAGAAIGGIAGERMKKFPIGGNQATYELYKGLFSSFTILSEDDFYTDNQNMLMPRNRITPTNVE